MLPVEIEASYAVKSLRTITTLEGAHFLFLLV